MKTVIIEISCTEVWQEVSGYLDGEAEPELKDRIEFHLKKCRSCRAVLDGMRNTVQLLTDGEWYPLPSGFSERLFKRLSSEHPKEKS
jgi:putative zinc finger protein